MTKIKFFAAALLLACSAPALAATAHQRIYVVGADVDVHGRITATQVDADVPANVASVLAGAVKQWQFEPAVRDGDVVPAHTFVRAQLEVSPTTDGEDTLSIRFMGNGPKLDTGNASPRYPMDEARAHHQAFAVLDATVQPDGSLTDMAVGSRLPDQPLRPAFEHAVLAAAKSWRAVPEQVDGQPVATKMRIPVDFTLSSSPLSRAQLMDMNTAAGRKRLIADIKANPPAHPFASDQPEALDSPLRPRPAPDDHSSR